MPLTLGTRLGAYEIAAAIGAGGMGEVYRARDTKLGRDVAIKVLPDHLASDPDRIARFQREAQLLASLNHPHIAAIYGLEDSGGVRALVLELVEGPTLADRIAGGALDVDEALAIATQIAEALEAAHERGVIHRDLKPGNVKVTPDGRVKVLDFGLAKMLQGETSSSSLSLSPTLSVQATMAGVILGTAAYMSPEQARGKQVDRRADIWAFGCVLFEMLAGRRAFEAGETISDVVAAILRSEPEWSALPEATPPAIRRLLRRCLTKDPRERLHDIADARLEIVDAVRGDSSPTTSGVARAAAPRRARERFAWSVAAALAVVALVLGALLGRSLTRAPADAPVFRSTIEPPPDRALNFGGKLAISPDGRRLAFVAEDIGRPPILWVRRLDGPGLQPLAGTEGASAPFWSPDSRHLAFVADGRLKRIDASGGPVLTVCAGVGLAGGTWNRDDVILFSPGSPGPIHRVPAAGGTPSAVTVLESSQGETRHGEPFFLPDGRHFVYRSAGGPDSNTLWVGSLDSPSRTRLLQGGAFAAYASGFLLFVRGAVLMAQRLDSERLALTGDAVPLAEQVQLGGPPVFRPAYSVSDTGVLVYQAGDAPGSQLVWLDRNGKEAGVLADAAGYGYVQLSPNGRQAAVSVVDTSTTRQRDIWIYEVERRLRTRFTTEAGDEFAPVWSPDGSRIAFGAGAAARPGGTGLDVFETPATDAGNPKPVTATNDVSEIPVSWSSDGRFMMYQTPFPASDLAIVPLTGDRKAIPFATTRFTEAGGQFSPDVRWIAFSSDETGRTDVYVAPFQRPGGKVPVSRDGGELPRWRQDGRELFYLGADSRVMSVGVRTTESAIDFGDPVPLFETRMVRGSTFPYAVTADGQRFLVNRPLRNTTGLPVTLVVNWPQLLKR